MHRFGLDLIAIRNLESERARARRQRLRLLAREKQYNFNGNASGHGLKENQIALNRKKCALCTYKEKERCKTRVSNSNRKKKTGEESCEIGISSYELHFSANCVSGIV